MHQSLWRALMHCRISQYAASRRVVFVSLKTREYTTRQPHPPASSVTCVVASYGLDYFPTTGNMRSVSSSKYVKLSYRIVS